MEKNVNQIAKRTTGKGLDVVVGGRSLEEMAEHVRCEGTICTPSVLRNSIIGGLEIRGQADEQENLIVFGCVGFGTALPVLSFCRLLPQLGISYGFLKKEYCCGAPLIGATALNEQERKRAEEASREFIGLNISQCRERGYKRMVYLCPWCVYLAHRFYRQIDIPQLYFPDILLGPLGNKNLSLKKPTVIAYYQGCQARRFVWDPGIDWDLDWPTYRGLLDRIDGLTTIDMPRYCCRTTLSSIFEWVAKKKIDTLVTPCLPCYGLLMRKAPPGLKVKSLSDILLDAVQG